jgi:hypothetical protein
MLHRVILFAGREDSHLSKRKLIIHIKTTIMGGNQNFEDKVDERDSAEEEKIQLEEFQSDWDEMIGQLTRIQSITESTDTKGKLQTGIDLLKSLSVDNLKEIQEAIIRIETEDFEKESKELEAQGIGANHAEEEQPE